MRFSNYRGQKLGPDEIAFPEGVKIDNSHEDGNLITMPDGSLWRMTMLRPADCENMGTKIIPFDDLLKNAGVDSAN